MASFHIVKNIANGCAVAAMTGFLCTGIVYAGKHSVPAETEPCGVARPEGSKPSGAEYGKRALCWAPEFDGLECFETIVSTGKHPRTVQAPRTENWNLSCAPQFDGLDCFATIVSTGKHPPSVTLPISVTKKTQPKNRGLTLAPQFDGLHCFETFISKK